MPYGQDIWLPAIRIETGVNDKFTLIEDVGGTNDVRTVTLSAGTYYAHNDVSLHATFPGLFRALELALAAATTTNTYTFEAVTPTLSASMTLAGVRIKATAAAVTFAFIISSPATDPISENYFGFRAGKGNDTGGGTWLSVTSGADEVLDSDYTTLGRWFSHTLLNDNAATDKRSNEQRNLRFSSNRIEDAVAVRWDSPKNRRIVYEWIKSPHIFNRADDTFDDSWFNGSDLNVDDSLNAFIDVWSVMSDLQPALIVHNNNTPDLQVDTHQYEQVKFRQENQARDYSNVYALLREAGEWYGLTVELFINPDADFYPH